MSRWFLIVSLTGLLAGCQGDNAMVDGSATSTPQPEQTRILPDPGRPNEIPPEPPQQIPPPDLPPRNEMPPPPQDIPPPPDPDIDPGRDMPIQVDTVEILIRESFPPMISAHVVGIGGGGCAEINAITQIRTGNLIEISITQRQLPNVVCDAMAHVFDQMIDIEGDFPPGEYIVRVNGVEQRFKI